MGNHHGHGSNGKYGKSSPIETQSSNSNGSRKSSIARTVSGNDIQDKSDNYSECLQKLAKFLTEKAIAEENVKGITQNVFTKYLFPRYATIGEKLYTYLHRLSKSKVKHIGKLEFMKQCDIFLHILDEDTIRELLVRMFSLMDNEDGEPCVTGPSLTVLLMCAYHVSMAHYSEGPQSCMGLHKTLAAIVAGCLHGKERLSATYVSNWLGQHSPRLLQPLHRYLLHVLLTAHRGFNEDQDNLAQGLELATPVLEAGPIFTTSKHHQRLLSMSMAWALAGALPMVYSRPVKGPSPSASHATGLASQAFLARLVCSVPSHWQLLYDSDDMGLGTNRFLHHTLSYRGPTLLLIKVDSGEEGGRLFCIASADEWRESHQYWGGEESAIFQLRPVFSLLEQGPKLLYLNTTVRGYAQGLRAGSDPRKPIIAIDQGFEKMEHSKIPYTIQTMEVWGCGDPVSREKQLDVKKWEVKEAERQRNVKFSAEDWLDHPDRYLLTLAGRPQYTTQN